MEPPPPPPPPPKLLHPGGGIGHTTTQADDTQTVAKASKAGRKPGSQNKQTTYAVMQWNQKELTLLCSLDEARAAVERNRGRKGRIPLENPKHDQSLKRVENLVRTLKESGNCQGLAACIFEEVRTGGGGERALEIITYELNQGSRSPGAWRFKLSGVVNPMSGKKEMYAIIWNSELLGALVVDVAEHGHCLMTDGFERLGNRARGAEQEMAPEQEGESGYDFKVGDAEIDLGHARGIWGEMKECELGWHANKGFDRFPTLFSFQAPALSKPLHIIAVHGATGAHFKSSHQQITETMFLQEICGQAAAQGEYVVLVGDFNTAEENNKTERLWDEAMELNLPENDASAGGDFDERAHLQATKERFLAYFKRGVPSSLPTNVYPFLAGGNATPKHNDDIWLPKDETFLRMDKPSGRLGERGSKQPGKVHKIPAYVLEQWENTTREYFDSLGTAHLKSASKHRLNELLSKVWSDHRPISVALKPPVERRGRLKGGAGAGAGGGGGAAEQAEGAEGLNDDEEVEEVGAGEGEGEAGEGLQDEEEEDGEE